MEIAVICVLSLCVAVLSVRLVLMKRDLKSISRQISEILQTDTNVGITVSTTDKTIVKTAGAFNRNLREIRKKELLLQSQNNELRTAIAHISHDLRTPLTAICGYLELLKTEEKSQEVNRCLEIIENRTDALKKLTQELFRYSLVAFEEETLQLEQLPINGVLEESVAAYYAAFKEKGIEPVISITEKSVVRRLDRTALLRIFANILSNALKYSDGDLEITLNDDADILFVNTASNLDAVQVGKIFDRFYTVENARTSTGLGLSIARSLAERMNGSVTASYDSGRLAITVSFTRASEV